MPNQEHVEGLTGKALAWYSVTEHAVTGASFAWRLDNVKMHDFNMPVSIIPIDPYYINIVIKNVRDQQKYINHDIYMASCKIL